MFAHIAPDPTAIDNAGDLHCSMPKMCDDLPVQILGCGNKTTALNDQLATLDSMLDHNITLRRDAVAAGIFSCHTE